MDDSLDGIKQMLIVFINIVAMFAILIMLYGYAYPENSFEIQLNNNDLKCYYNETYQNTFIISHGYYGLHCNTNIKKNVIPKSEAYSLTIKEFEVYDKSNNRIENSYWKQDSNYDYKEINDSKITLKIENKNGILYEGNYINDISDYLQDNGRYYFHVTVVSNRNPKYLAFVKTMISFNVIVGDSNEN